MTTPPTIRPETTEDHAAIDAVVSAAFGAVAEARLVRRIRDSPGYIPDLALVAEIDDVIVGHVMISRAIVRHDAGERIIVMLSPLAVAPDRQRRGIGRALVDDVMTAADDGGEPIVVLEGSPDYYGRLGFTPAADVGLTLPLPDWAPPEAAQVRLLTSHDPDDPTLRGTVVYSAAFDGLD